MYVYIIICKYVNIPITINTLMITLKRLTLDF